MNYQFKKYVIILIDFVLLPLTIVSSLWLKFIRKNVVKFFDTMSPFSLFIFKKVGVFPIIDHYYEPQFNNFLLSKSLRQDRNLPGIDINISKQLELLHEFSFESELIEISKMPDNYLNYSFNKGPFRSGDSEILFNMIRLKKPHRIIEIGCGHSTLMIQHAIQYNKIENSEYLCEHICIEPYENSWLKDLSVEVIREKVEQQNLEIFKKLNANDILFIDSTHIIRPQGDVLYEFLEIIPSLNSGVLIHIHDIFTPKDYLDSWKIEGINFWDEQYLLEAFLSFNNQFQIICAVNFLKHNYYEILASKCPLLTAEREPGSFWIFKN